MCAAIEKMDMKIAGSSAFVLGAGGGAGVAIVDELCAKGLRRLTVSDNDEVRRDAVLDLVARYWPDVEVSQDNGACDILINATTLGKTPLDECPFSDQSIKMASVVGDVVTHITATRLIGVSQAHGVRSISGEQMGQGQIATQLSFLGY
jgi:shikimate 5-dehydrogenase